MGNANSKDLVFCWEIEKKLRKLSFDISSFRQNISLNGRTARVFLLTNDSLFCFNKKQRFPDVANQNLNRVYQEFRLRSRAIALAKYWRRGQPEFQRDKTCQKLTPFPLSWHLIKIQFSVLPIAKYVLYLSQFLFFGLLFFFQQNVCENILHPFLQYLIHFLRLCIPFLRPLSNVLIFPFSIFSLNL